MWGSRKILQSFLHQMLPDVHLVFIGEGPHEQVLRQEATMRKVDHAVHFARAPVNRADAIRSCDVIVHPALAKEGMPLAVLEAMALGQAVLATPVGGIPEMIESSVTGGIVAVGDASSLAHAMFSFIKDTALRARVGEAARARVAECFAWDNTMEELATFVREAVHGA